MGRTKAITLDRDRGDGKYVELLNVLDYLSSTHGSAANALLAVAVRSPLYRSALANLKKPKKRTA